MKQSSSMLKLSGMLALALLISSVGFAQQKQESTTQATAQAGKKVTREEHIKMMNDKVASLEKKLSVIKTEAAAKKKDVTADYKALLNSVEGKMTALQTKLSSFKGTADEKVEAFKKETQNDWKALEAEYDKLHHYVYGEVKKEEPKKQEPKKQAPKN